MKSRLSLKEQPDGSFIFIPHPQQQQVDMDKPFQGIMLPNDVKENLLTKGNSGRVVELEPKPGVKLPSFVSIDKPLLPLVFNEGANFSICNASVE